MTAEMAARRTAAAAVLADYKTELASAPLSRPPGREWMLRLASVYPADSPVRWSACWTKL